MASIEVTVKSDKFGKRKFVNDVIESEHESDAVTAYALMDAFWKVGYDTYEYLLELGNTNTTRFTGTSPS